MVVGRHVSSLQFLDVLLGDRPALAPGENMYQRMLADNPDEVLDKAEALLAERSLLEYYDTVMLRGLTLAAQDEARGLLTREKATRMTHAMLQVIDDLSEHVDRDGAREAVVSGAAVAAGAVACISGAGPFDDAVSAMLCQLLMRAGVRARRISHDEVSRDRIAALDLGGVSVIALSYLDMTGSLSPLRYLVRRLRQRAPSAAVVVGLWPVAEAAGNAGGNGDAGRRDAVGADAYVGSLREALAIVAGKLGAGSVPTTLPVEVLPAKQVHP